MVHHYVWLDGLKQRTTSGYFSFRAVTKATAKHNLCLLSVHLAAQCSKAEEPDFNREFHVVWILFTTAVGRFSLTVLRRMTASQFFLAVLLATFQCQTQAYDKVLSGSEDLRNVTKCSWNCKVTESDLLEKSTNTLQGPELPKLQSYTRWKWTKSIAPIKRLLIQAQSSQKNCKWQTFKFRLSLWKSVRVAVFF